MAYSNTLVGSVCYSSIPLANNAYFSNVSRSVFTDSTQTIFIDHVFSAGVWYVRKTTIDNLGNSLINYQVQAVAPTLAACDASAPYFDGMAIGWGIVAAMAVAASLPLLKRSLGF